MQVKITSDNFINGEVPNPRRGEIRTVSDALGKHLIECGVAVGLKIEQPVKVKKEEPSPVSQAAQASQEETAKPRKRRSTKQSRSTTATE